MSKILENGLKFGDLTIIEFIGHRNKKKFYKCLCDCGKTRDVRQTNLVNGITTNCGCKNFVYKKHKNQKFLPTEASFRAKAANYKALAKSRGIAFDLSIEDTCKLLKGNCYYCNTIPSNLYNVRKSNRRNKKNKIQYSCLHSDKYDILYNGIDRIDNQKGYTIENTVSCCSHCNTAKLEMSLESFILWIEKVYTNIKIRKNESTRCI